MQRWTLRCARRSVCLLVVVLCVGSLVSAASAQAPVAAFSGSPLVGAPPLAVSFTDQSSSTPTAWQWSFGDGNTSTSQHPSHTYSSGGSYTVTLTVSNASGQDSETKLNYAVATTNRIVNVSTSSALRSACWNALDGDVILVANGTYVSDNAPFCRLEGKSNILLRSASGDPTSAVLRGYGWDSGVSNDDIIWLWGSTNISIGYLTLEEARYYGIKAENTLLSGQGLENINIYHCRFKNIGTRMIKGTGANLTPVQTGSIRSCHFENTKIPPSNWSDGGNYITAIDMMVLHDWVIADNTFKNIKGYSGGGRGAIFVWVESVNVTAERNVFTGCDRSIAYGNPSTSSDNPDDPHMTNGIIRNNFIVTGASKGIELCWVNGVKVYQNTLLTPSDSGLGINYLWNTLLNIHIANNIVRGQIWGDAGAGVTLEGNLQSGILDSWFANVSTGDLHLNTTATPAIDEVTRLADAQTDYDQQSRPTAAGLTDIGADEYVTASAPPVANFTGNPTSGTAPLTVAFTDTSTNSPTSWSWNFGDSSTSTAQNPSHVYAAGTFTVSLTATNAYGADGETKTNYITATVAPPVANFTGTPTSGTAPLAVAFTDTSTNSPTAWSWTFGDGGTSTAQHPSHTYAAGTYTVTLTATNAGGSDGETKTNYITATSGGGGAPTFVAAGTVASSTGAITPALPAGLQTNDILLLTVETANQACSITNQNGGTWAQVAGSPQGYGTAAASDATRLTMFWSRYNGTQGAPTVGDSGNHQAGRIIAVRGAATSGNPWDVTAGGTESTVDTSGSIPGATTTVANTLVVTAITTSLPDSNTTTNFSAWSNANLTSLTERTDNTRSAGNGGGLAMATGEKATAGAYGATAVTVVTASTKAMLSVALKSGGVPPVADFVANQTVVTPGTAVQFTDTSTNSPTSWSWTFGDGSTSTSQHPSHSYASQGYYTVSLTATNASGSDAETKTNYITVGVEEIIYPTSWYTFTDDHQTTLISGSLTDVQTDNGVYMRFRCNETSRKYFVRMIFTPTRNPATIAKMTLDYQWHAQYADTPTFDMSVRRSDGTFENILTWQTWTTTDQTLTWSTTNAGGFYYNEGSGDQIWVAQCGCAQNTNIYDDYVDLVRIRFIVLPGG